MSSPFTAYLAENYRKLKSRTTVGRRKAKLLMLEQFWTVVPEQKERLAQIADDPASKDILADALKEINEIGGEDEELISALVDASSVAGIVVRTDYSNDEAWASFVDALREAEKDLAAPWDDEAMAVNTSSGPSGSICKTEAERDSDSESESEDEEIRADPPGSSPPASLFALVSPPASSPLRVRLSGSSNLAVLRLFNDADAVRAPVRPAGMPRIKPGHRLVDLDGLVEAYSGPLVWVYDAQSNMDHAARVVNQRVEAYGAATADSWRARGSFLPELQLNLASGTMKIDFGGLDRWDRKERQRNMAEAHTNL